MTLVCLALVLFVRTSAAQQDLNALAPDGLDGAAEVTQLIAELSSDDYRTRENATRELSKAGTKAVPQIEKAALGTDLEAAFRSVRILHALTGSEKRDVEANAAAALERLAKSESTAVADSASDALLLYRVTQRERAIDELRALGAEVGYENLGAASDAISITISAGSWKGENADLNRLKLIPNLWQLSFFGLEVDDKTAEMVGELHNPLIINLFGTGISNEAYEKLVQRRPDSRIERRGPALLGIKGSIEFNGCFVSEVRPGTAAEKAGLRPEDQILSIDGQTMNDFRDLTSLVATKLPGDVIKLRIRRGNSEIEKNVSLGQWQ